MYLKVASEHCTMRCSRSEIGSCCCRLWPCAPSGSTPAALSPLEARLRECCCCLVAACRQARHVAGADTLLHAHRSPCLPPSQAMQCCLPAPPPVQAMHAAHAVHQEDAYTEARLEAAACKAMHCQESRPAIANRTQDAQGECNAVRCCLRQAWDALARGHTFDGMDVCRAGSVV